MKKLVFLAAILLMLTGCSTKYDTIPNKDISVKVRSIWVDVDYDSRVCVDSIPLEPLPAIEHNGIEPLDTIVPPH